MAGNSSPPPVIGQLAQAAGECFLVRVCKSQAGFYLGTLDRDGLPFTRESQEYWPTAERAKIAMTLGTWTQKAQP